MTRKEKSKVASDVRRQNRHLQAEIERVKADCGQAIMKMGGERGREKFAHMEASRQIATRSEALKRAERQIELHCTWRWWRRLRFLVTGQ